MSTVPTPAELAAIAAAELAAGRTAIITPRPGEQHAVSANGRWDYERIPGRPIWMVWDREADKLFEYASSADEGRRLTFEADHPLFDHPRREPRPATYSVV